jgi:RND family efflux transporter MFP subunit
VVEQPEGRTTRWWWKRGTWAAACLVAAAGLIVWATGSSASATTGYRTAEASLATVRQTLGVSGTTQPVHQATTGFQVAGTVSAVDVSVGQRVTDGQTLASLDTTSLAQAVSSAQLSVSAAEATLSENEAGESATSSSAGSNGGGASASLTADITPTTGGTTGTTGTGSPAGGTTAQSSTVSGDQQAVVAAQKTEDADAATAAADFAQAQTVCSSSSGGTTTTPAAPSTTTPTAPSTTTPTAPSTTTPSGSSTACTDALGRSLADEEQVSTDQKAVATAETTLAQALSSSAASSTGTSSGTTGGSASTPGGTTGSSTKSGPASGGNTTSGGGSTSSGTSSQSTDTAEQLASDQAAIDTAEATVIETQQSLADAQLTAPIGGTVASLSITAGQSVTAGSTNDIVTIINSGSYQVTSSLTSTQASQVKVGDTALVTVDGEDGTLTGTVARLGPVDTSGSSDTYPLIVALPAGSHGIAIGSTAQVQVVLHQVVGTLSVPTSAVHVTGTTSAYVNIVRSGQLVRKKVTIGAIGGSATQITSGISPGTSVVLADLSEAVPSSSTGTSTRIFGGGGFSGDRGGPSGGGFSA